MKISNLPIEYKKYVVARYYGGSYWYWGSYDDPEKAYFTAEDVGGQVFRSDDVQRVL